MDRYTVSFSSSQLSSMPEDTIAALFHSSNWEKIDFESRLRLCQEVENRFAERDGVEPRTVIPEKMNGSVYGEQRGNIIAINADMLQDGVFCTTYINEDGNKVTSVHSVNAPSWNTYDTVVHEHTHGVSLDKGEMPYTYISYKSDPDLYRIQGEERRAFARGNDATIEAIKRAETALNRADWQKDDYLESIKEDSYEKSLEKAKLTYNDPFVDKTLATFISDRDNGIIRTEASPSYKQIEAVYNEQIQRQLSEITQTKDQITEKDIENAITEAQNKTEEQITEINEKNDTLLEEISMQNESQNELENDGAIEEVAMTESDNEITSYNDGATDFSGYNGNTLNSDDGMGPDGISVDSSDGGMNFGDNDGASYGDDGGMSSGDDGGMSSGGDGGMSSGSDGGDGGMDYS